MIEFKRDKDLEAIVGELVMSEIQGYRLRKKASDKAAGYVHLTSGYFKKQHRAGFSTNIFSQARKIYTVSLEVKEIGRSNKGKRAAIREQPILENKDESKQ